MNDLKHTTLLLLFWVTLSISYTSPFAIQENNAMINYRQLLNIELKHSYFNDGKLNGFSTPLNQESLRFLQEFDLLIKTDNNSIQLFAPDTTTTSALIESGFTLQFDIVSHDSSFINYTELPMNEQSVVLFKNDSTQGDLAQLSATYQTTADPSQTVGRVSIDFSNLPITANEKPVNYTAQFTARAVAVKYIFILRPNMTQLKMKGDDAALFNGPYPTILPDGSNAQAFDSGTNVFPLSQKSSRRRTIDVTLNGSTINIALPQPSPYPLKTEDNIKVSTVYVYL